MPDAPPKPLRWPSLHVIRLLPKVSRPLTAGALIAVAFGGLLPLLFTLSTGFVVSRVPEAVRSGGLTTPEGRSLLTALGVLASVFLVQQLSGPFRQMIVLTLARRTSLHLRSRVMRATLVPHGIEHLEDPDLLDKVSLARGVGAGEISPGDATRGLFLILIQYVQWVGGAIIVARFWWWLAVLLVVVHVATRLLLRRTLARVFGTMIRHTRDLRRSRYFRDLVLTPTSAKETRVFGMRAWILERFGAHWLAGMREVWRERRKSRVVLAAIVVTLAATYGLAFIVLARAAATTLSPAMVTVLAGAIMSFATFEMDGDFLLAQGSTAIPEARALERILAERERGSGSRSARGMPSQTIRFENVTFRYPGTELDVFKNLTLEIRAGHSLAIVGPNGAGKTTLVKLLARLYEPTEGRITVDGVDIRELDPQEWQRRLGAIFQDFVQYYLPASDNVGFGAIERGGDRDALVRAAERAGALPIIDALPHGWETILSRQFEGGADISGGQWQRIALARALFAVEAGAGVLVLDEPTANLDVRAEVELFDRFLELTRGLTTLLISHRFSTVRRADRIVVLEHGRVTEDGTHDGLLELGGTYARMFRLQAARFVDVAEAEVAP